MNDFKKVPKKEQSYPKQTYDGQEDQSFGFNPAYKLQTGNLRGTQGVGYGSVKIEGENNRITVGADQATLSLGDLDDTNDSFGLGINDDEDNQLIILGKTTTDEYGLSIYDEDNMRILAGKYSDGSIKIKLSQPGYEVSTATDDQLIWSSDFNLFKIVLSGTEIVTVPGGHPEGTTYNESIAHGLGYVPAYIVHIKPPTAVSTTYHTNPISFTNYDAVNNRYDTLYRAYSYTDTTNVIFTVESGLSGFVEGDWTFKYYLLQETAA